MVQYPRFPPVKQLDGYAGAESGQLGEVRWRRFLLMAPTKA